MDAVFFDVENDGDQDLYVVSGGGASPEGRLNEDRLYINTGQGRFEKWTGSGIMSNGSCVAAGDFNNDGFTDLFVGTRFVFGKYGISPESYVLWNNGNGGLSVNNSASGEVFKDLGMVTDALWNPQKKELVVVGEWMPVTFFRFEGNGISKWELPDSSGWWNTVYASDLDNDGDLDLLLGNAGSNSALRASVEEPIKLIVRDWDHNGSLDPLITYYRQGEQYLFNGLDELKEQMPAIRKRYNSYAL